MASGANVVEILVKATDQTAAGFAGASAGADELAAKTEAAMTEYEAAMAKAADEQARLEELQASGAASADELAAAQDRVTAATLASIDAQVKLGQAELEESAAAREAGVATEETAAKTDAAGASATGFGSKLGMVGLGLGIASVAAVKMAGDFQASMTKLVTSAGESASNLKSDMAGVLQISVQTATGTKELAAGLYMINSAGFHGAQGLDILKASAEGARAEGASLADVSNAVTSALNAYGLKGKDAVAVTNQLVTTVGQGKMTMQDLASSIHSVLPVAAQAHISLAQVGGAIATMTMQGMSAKQATLDLAHVIGSLQNPNNVAIAEMQQLGLSSNDVANKLGQRGLTGTIQLLENAIAQHMGPSGDVMLSVFNKSKSAAQDATTMIANMPPAIQGTAKAFLDGSITAKQWRTDLQGMPPIQAAMAQSFATVADKANGFNSLLKAGSPAAQTFAAALSKVMGGQMGLNAALMVGGSHMSAFKTNVDAVAAAGEHAGKNVNGWAEIQKTFNFQLAKAKDSAQAVAISFGSALLPAATSVMGVLASLGGWLAKNTWAAVTLAAVIGGTLSFILGGKLVSSISEAAKSFKLLGDSELLQAAASKVAAAGQWLLNAAMAANPIGIVIAIIVALVAAFVLLWTHSAAFRQFWIGAWHDITAAVSAAFDWVKSHWPLILGILTGPIGLAVVLIVQHWHQIVSGVQAMVGDVTSWFRGLPGRILGAVGDLGSLLFNAGARVIQGLINGIGSMIGSVGSAIGSIASEIVSHLPFSPAKKGPLSGAGAPEKAGQRIAQLLGQGMTSGLPSVTSAAARLAGGAGVSGHGTAGGAGGGAITLNITGSDSSLTKALVLALRKEIRVQGGVVQTVLGH